MYLWIIAAVAAYFIKGLCGFANTLVFTSILSFGASNANISPIDLLLGYPTNLILTWKNRKSLDPKVYLPLAALVLAGSIPGALLLKNVDARAIKQVFGVTPKEYADSRRLCAAKEILAATQEKVIDVAYQSGFSSLAAFNRFFKQQTGQTPTEYRKEH